MDIGNYAKLSLDNGNYTKLSMDNVNSTKISMDNKKTSNYIQNDGNRMQLQLKLLVIRQFADY